MIELLNDYFDSQSTKPMIVGGIIGTNLFQYAIDAATSYTSFEKVLIIEGVQDFIGMHVNIPYHNHRFYAELFENRLIMMPRTMDSLESFFTKDLTQKIPVLTRRINTDVVIINDAHLIPEIYLNQLLNDYQSKIVCIVDPFDIGGENYGTVPTVIDTLHKLPNLMVRARGVFGIESRAIDKKVSSILDKKHVTPRSLGKLDENQYVTNDKDILNMVQNKQRNTPFKKNQKLIVRDKHIIHSMVPNELNTGHEFLMTDKTMLQITQTGVNMLYMQMRVFSSKHLVYALPTYQSTGTSGNIHVDPANILCIDDMRYHRFKNILYYPGNAPSLTKRECYALLKCTNHLTIAE